MRQLALFVFALLLPLSTFTHADAPSDKQRSLQTFQDALKVFRHPRCLNCHPGGDRPTQGEDMHVHIMNVQRGLDDLGTPQMRCYACHTTENYSPSNVPGAPKWALAPRRLAWQGLSDHELCVLFKDTKRTHMTMAQFIKHNAEDTLVGWAWHPGKGREPAPGTQLEFGRAVAEWVNSGAACPD